ncbi:MAG: PHP domain-containing protein [Hyphomicrobiales bacterium]
MNLFKADIHIHTLLSPCGDLEMSPDNIINKAIQENLQIIGITDHNSTRQAPLIKKLAQKHNIYVLLGAEVTSKEEAHCLCFFENETKTAEFQQYLDQHLANIKNDPDQFGYQVVVDEDENIVYQEDKLLISAINKSIDEIYDKVTELNGIFIPAHIDKLAFSLTSQLGFIPPDIKAHALEIGQKTDINEYLRLFAYLSKFTFIKNSDAHIPELIGSSYSNFYIEEPSFLEIKLALENKDGRKVLV